MERQIHNDVFRLALASLIWSIQSCEPCDREGCDALAKAAPERGTGVAGIVAESSDVVTSGCQECSFGEATLQIWRVDAPVAVESEAVALLDMRQPDLESHVSGRYSHALEAGSYLLCVRPNCVDLTVFAGETVTINIKRRDGPTGFFVVDADVASVNEDFGLDVGY